jgi:hypothetical protein
MAGKLIIVTLTEEELVAVCHAIYLAEGEWGSIPEADNPHNTGLAKLVAARDSEDERKG